MSTPDSTSSLEGDEAALLALYRRLRRGQKDMLRELAELMIHRDGEAPRPAAAAPPPAGPAPASQPPEIGRLPGTRPARGGSDS